MFGSKWWQDFKSPALSECLGQSDGAKSEACSPLITSIQIHIARRRPFLPCFQSHKNIFSLLATKSSPSDHFLTPPTLCHAQSHLFTLLRVTMTLLTIITRTSRLLHLIFEAGPASLAPCRRNKLQRGGTLELDNSSNTHHALLLLVEEFYT